MVSPSVPKHGEMQAQPLANFRVLGAEPRAHPGNIPHPLGGAWMVPYGEEHLGGQGWDLGLPVEPGTAPSIRHDYPAGPPSITPPWTIDLANDNKQTNKSSFGGRSAGDGAMPAGFSPFPAFPCPAWQPWEPFQPSGKSSQRKIYFKATFYPVSALF